MINSPIYIFTDHLTDRLIYVLDFLFKNKGQEYKIIDDSDETTVEIAIAYSNESKNAKIHIQPSQLLNETDIKSNWNIGFNATDNDWTINDTKDDLSIIFYFLSRYEEYNVSTKDHIGRFTAHQSILFQKNQLDQPWCDIIVKRIWEKLALDYKSVTDTYQTILSYDIDIAWAYKYKPYWRNTINFLRNMVQPKQFLERLHVIRGKLKDPYDNYDIIKENAKKHQTILFFLLGDYGRFDKNHHWKNKALRHLINDSKVFSDIGIHPSFKSFLNDSIVNEEQRRLSVISGLKVDKSRQHFLRLAIPESYQLLEKIGISSDYTMGYAEHCGFRAGTSFPFSFFDLKTNKETALKVVPFAVMDGTLKEYMKLTPIQAIEMIQNLKESVKAVGGQFIPIWHNHSIGNTKEWRNWQQVYNACID